MSHLHRFSFIVLLASFVVVGCNKGKTDSSDRQFDVKGKVVAIDVANKKVKLDHEDIPGLMPAMAMFFHVEDLNLLDGLQVGDQVLGKCKANYLLTELKKR